MRLRTSFNMIYGTSPSEDLCGGSEMCYNCTIKTCNYIVYDCVIIMVWPGKTLKKWLYFFIGPVVPRRGSSQMLKLTRSGKAPTCPTDYQTLQTISYHDNIVIIKDNKTKSLQAVSGYRAMGLFLNCFLVCLLSPPQCFSWYDLVFSVVRLVNDFKLQLICIMWYHLCLVLQLVHSLSYSITHLPKFLWSMQRFLST